MAYLRGRAIFFHGKVVREVIKVIQDEKLEDVSIYTSKAEDRILRNIGVSDFYYALKRFDAETFTHSQEVARLAVLIGVKRGFSEERLVNLAISGYLHDIGKIFTGIGIIGKKGCLTAKEYAIVKEHPVVGYRHLKNFIQDEEILSGVLQHHERLDGSGYVDQMWGDEISEFGKVIAVADVFCAMISVRAYKSAYPPMQVIQQMVYSEGFDHELIDILVSFCSDGKLKVS